jgi:hypothetical protein
MPAPSASLGTLRPDLGSLMEFDLERNRAGFIAYRVLPILEADTSGGTFGRIPSEQLGKLATVTRNSEGGYNRISYTFTKDTFTTQEYGLEGPVDERNARLYRNYFDAELVTSRLLLHNVLARAELRVASAVFNTSTWTGSSLTTAVSTEWSTGATAAPVTDVRTAAQVVRNNCGQYPNALIICRKVFRNLQDCTQIRERITSSGAGNPAKASDITAQMLAQVFDIEQVIVADSAYDTATEGQATTFGDIWDDEYAMVCVLAKDGDGVEMPSIGRTFHWDADGSSPGGTIESYEDPKVRGNVIRVRHETHEKIIYPEAGHLLSNITA